MNKKIRNLTFLTMLGLIVLPGCIENICKKFYFIGWHNARIGTDYRKSSKGYPIRQCIIQHQENVFFETTFPKCFFYTDINNNGNFEYKTDMRIYSREEFPFDNCYDPIKTNKIIKNGRDN